MEKIKGLLIDIDDTIVRKKACDNSTVHNTTSLMDILHLAGVELSGLSEEETAYRIKKIDDETQWWHWSDFIVELGLNPKQFWDYAYIKESEYLEATGADILPSLIRLRDAGILLYITSNNPSSGILHKLRIAGVADNNGTTLFSQLLGATELHAMKWEPIYWKKALAHIAFDADEVAVVGDSLRDDYEIPHSVGIAHSFIIDRIENRKGESSDSCIFVQSFEEIADVILGENK